MSPRDIYWFIAGAASGLMVGAVGVYLAVGSPTPETATAAASPTAQTNTTPDLLMPGDQWPTLADAQSTVGSDSGQQASSAGSLDEVTRKLAERLATHGGTDDEWRLLAQSYDYMGRTNDARSARMHVAAGEKNATPDSAAPAGASAAPATGAAPHASGAAHATESSRIWGTVQIAHELEASAKPGTALFIYAMDPSNPGPPLAVLRLRVNTWPITFALDDADAMIPGRNLSSAQRIQLEARISPSGEALPKPGDLVGRLADVDPRTTHPVNIVIDHKIG